MDIIEGLKNNGIEQYQADKRLIYAMIGNYDQDESGGIDFKEFLNILSSN